MADLTITASQVQKGTDASTRINCGGVAGETITPGQTVYVDTTDSNKVKLASAGTKSEAVVAGIAISEADSGQVITYQVDGTVTLGAGAAPVQGTGYWVSATTGGIAPEADLGTGDFKTFLGVADDSNGLKLGIFVSGVSEP